jgi:AraC-like DNA-binding protein
MNTALLAQLAEITPEEQCVLQGKTDVDKHIYTEAKDFTVDSKKMLGKGKLIDIRPHTRFVHFPKHRHNYIEIIYMCSGETTHIINSSKKIVLQTGDLLFLNQYSFHEILPAGKNDIGVNFIILPEFFDDAFEMIEQDSIIGKFLISTLRQDDAGAQYIHFKAADVLPVQNLIENMVWSLVNHQDNRRRINQYTMELLFMQLLTYTDRIDVGAEEQYDRHLTLVVLKYIEEYYKEANLTDLSAQLNQSISKLSRLIKSNTGNTFKELVQEKRLGKATYLLSKTNLSVSDIISAVGYDNSSYFYRIFKAKYGVSPKEYRYS